MSRSPFSPALLSDVVTTGDALHSAGSDFRSAFVASALANHAARHASPSVPSSAIVAANKVRPVVAGVPRYVSPSSVDSHALAGLALSYGYDDTTDPFDVQSIIIAATKEKQGFGVPAARKALRGDYASCADALAALADALAAFVPVETDTTDDTTDTTTGDDDTTDDDAPTATRITTGLALILDALNDGEDMTEEERATFLALMEKITMADALAA